MVMHFAKYSFRPVGLLLVVLFGLSLVWCCDTDCRTGSGEGQCASLICSLFAVHDNSDQNTNRESSTTCVCVCHMPVIPAVVFGAESDMTAHSSTHEYIFSAPSSPIRSIYRPPRA
jgi:hypothetical protein